MTKSGYEKVARLAAMANCGKIFPALDMRKEAAFESFQIADAYRDPLLQRDHRIEEVDRVPVEQSSRLGPALAYAYADIQ